MYVLDQKSSNNIQSIRIPSSAECVRSLEELTKKKKNFVILSSIIYFFNIADGRNKRSSAICIGNHMISSAI